jgi:Tol biopolymer transport system component
VTPTARALLLLLVAALIPACGSGSGGAASPVVSSSEYPAAGASKLVSVALPRPGNNGSDAPDITPDGRYVVFSSFSNNLVPNDSNSQNDVFVKDLHSGEIRRVSISSAGIQADGGCYNPSISDDGRYVAFESYASNLVPGDTNSFPDIFVHDRDADGNSIYDETFPGARSTTRISVGPGGVQLNADSYRPQISGNGQYVVYYSYSSQLDPRDTNFTLDVFRTHLPTGTTELVSLSTSELASPNDTSYSPSISQDGRYVAYLSYATDIVATPVLPPFSFASHVYWRDMDTPFSTKMLSVTPAAAAGNSSSYAASINADGRYVAFMSYSSDLVAGDTNFNADIFVRDTLLDSTIRVSVSTAGVEGTSYSDWPRISGDGNLVAFSTGSTLDAGDTTFYYDVYVRDIGAGSTTRVSLTAAGLEPTGDCYSPAMNADGSLVVFQSYAPDIVDGDDNFTGDVFVRNRDIDGSGPPFDQLGDVSTEGVSFVPGQSDNHSFAPAVSFDGRYVAFESLASNIAVGTPAPTTQEIFRRDGSLGLSVLASPPAGSASKFRPSISASGRYVSFQSAGPLVGGDTNGVSDVFLRDVQTSLTRRVSVENAAQGQANGPSGNASMNANSTTPALDGRWVVFESMASNLVAGDTNGFNDIFVHDRDSDANGTFDQGPGLTSTVRVSLDSSGGEADAPSYEPAISADGRYVVFSSAATNLVAGDGNGAADIFRRDLQTGTTIRISVSSAGAQADGGSYHPRISADGNVVAFMSTATNLVPGDTNGFMDVFVRNVSAGSTVRASVAPSGGQADGPSYNPSLSADGVMVAFDTTATNLGGAKSLGYSDVYVRDLSNGTTVRASVSVGGSEGNGDSLFPVLSGDGAWVAFYTGANNLLEVDVNGRFDVVIRGPLR